MSPEGFLLDGGKKSWVRREKWLSSGPYCFTPFPSGIAFITLVRLNVYHKNATNDRTPGTPFLPQFVGDTDDSPSFNDDRCTTHVK